MTSTVIRTRIAPSPTGFLHLGTARTALFSWAYARHYGGQFVLRIEDTDVARSTQDSVEQILASMKWLGLEYDEGPVYQMQRLERYHAVVQQMIEAGTAYYCYCTPQDLDEMREGQKARGEKTRYDGRWRPEAGKTLPPVPAGVKPVVRFKNPLEGDVTWEDLVKGPITINNREIDDLIIMRPADGGAEAGGNANGDAQSGQGAAARLGVPTYNFAVVVDDWDMAITHVFRGDEHINNTPWQINIFRALGAPLPQFGHIPVILGDDGLKLSKRRGAVSVTAYEENGYLPEGMLNYLARLGWSHGDDELFTREQLVQWFDGTHIHKSPAQWDPAKLEWVNAHYIKQADDERLATLVTAQLAKRGLSAPERLPALCALFKDRCSTTVALADWLSMYVAPVTPSEEDKATHLTDAVKPAIRTLADKLDALAAADWTKAAISAAIKETITAHGLKMPQLAIPVRVLVCGRAQTPSVDAVLELFNKEILVNRLRSV